jgi:hypothetical protein
MFVEFAKFIRQNVRVWHEVEVLLSIPLLHPDNIEAQTVLSGDLVTLREVIDLLVFVQALVEIALAT